MWTISKNGDNAFFIKKGRFFKIDNDAYIILDLLNRKKTIEQVSEMTNTRIDDIVGLLEELERIGETDKGKTKKFHPIILIIPHKLSEKIGKALSPFFSSLFLGAALLVLALCIVVVIGNKDSIYPVNQISITAYLISLLIISIIHELGHISAAHSIKLEGCFDVYLGIYTFLLSFYVEDLNHLYLRTKKECFIVNAGGIYFQLLMFGPIAVMLYFGIFPNLFSALLWTNIILLLFNIFPFFVTDGYWILSDYIAEGELNKRCRLISKEILNLHVRHKYPFSNWIYWVFKNFFFIWILLIWLKVVWHRIQNLPEIFYIVIENPLEIYTILRVLIYLLPIILPILYVRRKIR